MSRDEEDMSPTGEAWARSFAQVSEGMFILDRDFNVIQCNEAFAREVGMTHEEIIGKTCYSIVHGLECSSESCVTCAAVKRCESARDELYEPFLDKHIEVSADPVLDENGEFLFVVHTLRDVTERVALAEKETELAGARVAAMMAQKHSQELTNLVLLAAHELRQPATIFMSYSQMLLESGGRLEDDQVINALEAIERATDRISQIVSKLMESSYLSHGRLTPLVRLVTPHSVVVRAVQGIRSGEVENEFKVSVPSDEEPADLDPEMINKVLTMLLENAVKFSPVGSAIDISVRQTNWETVFAVADRGEDIPEEDREMIFERFYQVGDILNHSKPGLGLGLYIAKEIVTAHDGWIKQEPRQGGGSVFSFGVPRAAASMQRDEAPGGACAG